MTQAEASGRRTIDLDEIGFARLVFQLLRKRFTGRAQVEQAGVGPRQIWLRGGMPVFTDWASEADAIGELLVSRRIISASTRDQAVQRAKSESKPTGQVLMDMGALDPQKLSTALRLQCAQKLTHAFALRAGSVELIAEDELDLPDEIKGQVNVLALVHRGVEKHYDMARMSAEMGESWVGPARGSKALTRYQSQFGFAKEAGPVLRKLMQGIKLGPFREGHGLPGMQIAFCLWACQMLRIGDAASPAARAQSGARPKAREVIQPASAPPKAKAEPKPSPTNAPLPPPPGLGAAAGDSRPPPPPSRPDLDGPPPPPLRGDSLPKDSDPPIVTAVPPPLPRGRAGGSAASERTPPGPSSSGATRSRPPVQSDPKVRAALEAEFDALEAKIADEANAFALFGLEPGKVGRKEVRAVWADLSKRLHPDALESQGLSDLRPRAERCFAAISEAYGILSSKDEREKLEAVLQMGGTGKVGEDASQLVKNALEAEMLMREAERHVRGGHYARALDEYRRANSLNPEMPEILAGLAYCEFANGAHTGGPAGKALDILEGIVKENEKLAAAHYFIGMVCVMSQQNTSRALQAFDTAYALNPRLVEAQRQLNALRIKQRQAAGDKKKKKKGFGGIFGR